MSKFLKFIVILSVALTVLFNYSYTFAAVDMNLGNNTNSILSFRFLNSFDIRFIINLFISLRIN